MTLKAIDPKDRVKLVALVLAALCVFGFSFFQTASYDTAQNAMVQHAQARQTQVAVRPPADGSAAPHPGIVVNPVKPIGPDSTPPVATTTAGATTTPVATPAPIAGVPIVTDQSTLAAGPPTGGKDPFLPTGKFAVRPSPSPKPVPVVKTSPLPDNKPNPGDFARDMLTGLGHSPASATTAPVFLPPPPPPAYTVTGVIVADRDNPGAAPIAILKGGATSTNTLAAKGSSATTVVASGGSERRFVTIGDPVGNGFVVAAVRVDGVDLRSGKRLVTLKLGTANGNLK